MQKVKTTSNHMDTPRHIWIYNKYDVRLGKTIQSDVCLHDSNIFKVELLQVYICTHRSSSRAACRGTQICSLAQQVRLSALVQSSVLNSSYANKLLSGSPDVLWEAKSRKPVKIAFKKKTHTQSAT